MAADCGRGEASAVASADEQHYSVMIMTQVRFLREALAEIVCRDQRLSISGLCERLDQAEKFALERQPDIVLLDAAFPDGMGAVRQIRQVVPGAQVVVLAIEETEENIVAWAEAGVTGYIPGTAALAELTTLLGNILRGEQSCSGRVAARLLRQISAVTRPTTARSVAPPRAKLTARELQIIKLIQAGLSNKEIARRLDIGVATTKSHVHNILGKLELQRRGQVARRMSEISADLRVPWPQLQGGPRHLWC